MKQGNIYNSFFAPRSIGFDRILDIMESIEVPTFPPHDLIKISDDVSIIKMAVAGYSSNDISIVVNNNILEISGTPQQQDNLDYLHRGIANRKFKKAFILDEYFEVTGSALKDGMLFVKLKYNIPEEKKPKHIEIQSDIEFLKLE